MEEYKEDYIKIIRPVKYFNSSDMKDLNIIGIYKISHKEKLYTPAPWLNFKNLVDSRDNREEKDNRNDGFSILASKDNVSTFLRKTKFCTGQIQYGCCNRKVCYFAHNMKEYNFPICAFKNECKKDDCSFMHPLRESVEKYKYRINFKVPKNIS